MEVSYRVRRSQDSRKRGKVTPGRKVLGVLEESIVCLEEISFAVVVDDVTPPGVE